MSFFISSSKAKKWSLLIFELQLPMLLFLRLFNTTGNEKWSFYVFYGHYIHPLPSSGSHGYFLDNLSMSSCAFLVCLHAVDPHYYKPHQKAFFLPTKEPIYSLTLWHYRLQVLLIHSFPYFIFIFFLQQRKKKVDKTVLNKSIILGLLMKKPFHWLMKIMIIMVHQIQAG